MRSNAPYLMKPVLAGLTLLLAFQGSETLLMTVFTAAAALFITHFFKLTKALFPKSLLKLAVFLTAAAVFQIVSMITGRPAFWFVSLAFLLESDDLEPNHLGVKPLPALRRILLFAGFSAGCLFIQEISKQASSGFFKQPAGLTLLAGLAVWAVTLGEKPFAGWRRKKRARS